jgi:acetyl-CoA carboxylase biotin carboxyl carrier protein
LLYFKKIYYFQTSISKKMEKKEIKPTTKPSVEGSTTFDIQEINDLLKAFTKSNVNELKLEKGDFKVTIKQGVTATPVMMASPQMMAAAPAVNAAPAAPAATPAAAPASAPAAAPAAEKGVIIKSPMIGTFYRSAGPGKPVFVNVGDKIESGKVLCIVEAMKLFNEIEAEISGTILKVLVDDASPVEYDQPLFLVDPS